MQKIVTIRASQKDLEKALTKFVSFGWRVLNATKGSEWGRVGLSYKWTIVLDINEHTTDADALIKGVKQEFSSKSFTKTILIAIGSLVGIIVLLAIIIFATL